MKSHCVVVFLLAVLFLGAEAADSKLWEYADGDVPFEILRKEDLAGLESMESMIYHYFEHEEDTDPILSVEYLRTPFDVFARSFQLHTGAFVMTEGGQEIKYNTVEVSLLSKTIIYLFDFNVVHVHANATPDELVQYNDKHVPAL